MIMHVNRNMANVQPTCMYLFHVDFKWPRGLTLRAGSRLHFLILALIEWSQYEATLEAVILDHVELWENPCAAGHYTTCPDELVKMKLSASRRQNVRLKWLFHFR